jgi:hypothetical protein
MSFSWARARALESLARL